MPLMYFLAVLNGWVLQLMILSYSYNKMSFDRESSGKLQWYVENDIHYKQNGTGCISISDVPLSF